MKTHKFHNQVLTSFAETYYGNILKENNLIEEIVIEDTPLWYAVQNGRKYLLSREIAKKLPIKVKTTEEEHYRGKVYYVVKDFETVSFRQEKNHTFRELVDNVGVFDSDNPQQNLLYRLLCWTAHLDRLNFRVATSAGFGKDSMWEVLHILKRDVAVTNPRTMAAIEYRLSNKVIVLNELSNLTNEQNGLIQTFLLMVGDLRTSYEKSTRATAKTKDYYSIKDLSLVVMYNDLDYYKAIGKDKKYFDNVYTKAVKDRFLSFKFTGSLTSEQFVIKESPELVAKVNRQDYVRILRSIEYHRNHWREEVNPSWKVDLKSLGLSPRQQQAFGLIVSFVSMYAASEFEFKTLVKQFVDSFTAYDTMLLEGKAAYKLTDDFAKERKVVFTSEGVAEKLEDIEEVVK